MSAKPIACPCCGCLTLESAGRFDICEVCFWEDDPLQRTKPNLGGGANVASLTNARENYSTFGASELAMLNLVRKPTCDEKGRH